MTLYLLPNLLAEEGKFEDLPSSIAHIVPQIDALIAESEKGGRRFLKLFTFPLLKTFRDVPIHLLNEHTEPSMRDALVKRIAAGGKWGLISDAGMPCLADPGADLVLQARRKGVQIRALAGPSSPLLALVLSGLGGQRFTFHGYLPKEKELLTRSLKEMERASRKEGSVHLFIEAPYRNEKLLAHLLISLEDKTLLGLASDLTSAEESVAVYTIAEWRKRTAIELDDHPTIFLLKV
jgi:16S rRNA (cytidine1402-2'-O)-methyltransferase